MSSSGNIDLRALLAGQALQGLCTGLRVGNDKIAAQVAIAAIKIADATIAALQASAPPKAPAWDFQ